tara:strand:- start:75 stop:422 length:348 start_codon:yes stop_codon:yes gene_type:complete
MQEGYNAVCLHKWLDADGKLCYCNTFLKLGKANGKFVTTRGVAHFRACHPAYLHVNTVNNSRFFVYVCSCSVGRAGALRARCSRICIFANIYLFSCSHPALVNRTLRGLTWLPKY